MMTRPVTVWTLLILGCFAADLCVVALAINDPATFGRYAGTSLLVATAALLWHRSGDGGGPCGSAS